MAKAKNKVESVKLEFGSVSGTEFEYDADGNLLSDGAFVYEYDA